MKNNVHLHQFICFKKNPAEINEEFQQDLQSFVDYGNLTYSPQFAAECFGLTTRRLKDIEEEYGVEIRRIPRGTSSARVYGVADLFTIAALTIFETWII